MARPFYRFEKIDDIINFDYELFTKEARKKIYVRSVGESLASKTVDVQIFYDNAIEYFIDKQNTPHNHDAYSELIGDLLGVERHSEAYELSETSKYKIKTFVDQTWGLLQRYEKMKSGEIHQIWMHIQTNKEKIRVDRAISEVRRTYEIYDMGRWLSMDTWTPAEAAAISLQVEPRFASDLPENFDQETIRDFGKALTERTDEIVRAMNADVFRNGIITPKSFLSFAIKKGWPISNNDPKSKNDNLSTNTKHRFYSILIAAALERYEMELQIGPKFTISGKFSMIEQDCQKWNLHVSEKSIRGYLTDAVKWAQEDRSDAMIDAYNRNNKRRK